MRWCLLVVAISLAAGAAEDVSNSTEPRWLSKYVPPLLSRLQYGENEASSASCKLQGALYKSHLKNQTLWAITMHDASSLHWDSLVTGGSYNLGSFDACRSINVPEFSITGRYCVVGMGMRPLTTTPRELNFSDAKVAQPNPLDSIWTLFQETADPRVAKKDDVKFAMCIPSGCSHIDLGLTLTDQLFPPLRAEGLDVSLQLEESQCMNHLEETQLDRPAIVYLSVVGFLFFLTLIVSIAHSHCMSEERQLKFSQNCCLSAFSLLNSGRKLIQVEGPADLHFLSGTKVLSMFLIIFGHRYLASLYAPNTNVIDLELKYNDVVEMFLFNGPLIVNTFLVLSGFFTYYKILNDIEKCRGVNIPLYIYYRWLRMTSVVAPVILFSGLISPHFQTGPGWKFEGLMRFETCRRNWWVHLLYINNYYRADEECILPGWYLGVDMQLFVIAVLLGFCVSKWRKTEIPLLASFFTLALVIPGVVTYFAGYPPILKFYPNYIRRYYKADDYVNGYTKTHMRAAPYVLGMITAKIYFKLKEKKFHFNKATVFLLVLAAFAFSDGVLFAAWPFFHSVVNPRPLVSALYSSFSKVSWGLAICIFILAQVFGEIGVFTDWLGSKIYAPFNRLTLHALVIHPLVQTQCLTNLRRPATVTGWIIFWSAAGDIAVSYSISILLYFFVEGPINALNDYILRKFVSKPKSEPGS